MSPQEYLTSKGGLTRAGYFGNDIGMSDEQYFGLLQSGGVSALNKFMEDKVRAGETAKLLARYKSQGMSDADAKKAVDDFWAEAAASDRRGYEIDENGNKINRDKRSQNADKDIEPKCETDEAFRNNEQKLLDAKSRTYFYAELPTPILKNIITPVARVHEILTEEFKSQCTDYDSVVQTLYDQFRKKNERYIGLLAKEFEMRKAASKFAKAKVASTGDIDVNKIYKYQLDDSIFKKIMR
jgi:hypothetical protein